MQCYLNGLSAFLFLVVNKMLLNLSHQFFKDEHGSAVGAGTTTEPYRERNEFHILSTTLMDQSMGYSAVLVIYCTVSHNYAFFLFWFEDVHLR